MKATSTIMKMVLLFIIAGISPVVMAQRFVHPGIPFTKGDLDLLKANITKEPWLSAYNSFRNNGRSRLSYGMQGPFVEVGRSPDINRTQWQSDMVAIHNLAFMWIFTGDSAYARKATNMVDAWAVTNTVWSGGESMLDLGDYARYYVTGADILRGTFPGWTAANTAHVKNWLEKVIWPASWVPWPLRDHNKGAIQLEIALSVAAFLDDKTKWDQAVEVYRMDAGGGLRNSLPEGEVADAGRDDHWHAQMDALIWDAEVAWKQGVDLFAEMDNRLLAVAELYNHYAIDPTGLSYIPFGGYSAYYTNWGIPTGARRQAPYNNITKAAYSLRKGIATPYTDQMRVLVGEGAGSFLFYKSADTSTAIAPAPIVYPATEAVNTLTNVNVGAAGITGSAVYDNGIWTVNGAGTSVADVFNFTGKQVSGNAAVVAKVESNSAGGAITGLMIRESLAGGSKYVTVDMHAWGGVKASGRGDTRRTAGGHGQPKAPWWLKLERVGNRVFTYHSQDGVHWSNHALFITTLPDSVYMGMYTESGSTSTLNTVKFSHVAFTNTNPPGAPVINSATRVSSKIDTAFSYAVTATNQPTRYSASSLPPGLSIDPATGVISGTPTALGTTWVTVSATNAKGTGTAIVTISITSKTAPGAPPRLRGWAQGVVIKVAWGPSVNATSYSVKRAMSPDGPFVTLDSGVTARDYVDDNPVPGVTNYYVVTAFAGDLESWNSNVVSAVVPPAPPERPVAISKNNQIDLNWTAASGATSYIVKRATVSGGPYTTVDTVTATTYVDTDVVNGSPYYYIVSSVANGLESAYSAEAFGVQGASSGTWSPTPSSDIWNLGADWVEGGVPVSPAILTFNESTDTVLTNDINGLKVSRILFDTEAGAYNISGNGIVLRNDLVNRSANEQTLDIPIVLDKDLNVNTSSQNIILPDSISGSGTLLKTGQSILFMRGNNTYSGNTTINGTMGGWPPQNGIGISGNGMGTSGAPLSGPLGTGKIIMNGGSLFSSADATIYNDIEISAGKWSYFYQTGGAMNVKGRLSGSGTIMEDCNTYSGLRLSGDNSEFTGEFRTRNRSGAHRVYFDNAVAGSAKAVWILEANNPHAHVLNYGTDTMYFGALWGGGYIRSYWGNPTISIGALNYSTTYGGTMRDFINIEKTGTGTLTFTGNHVYYGTTTVTAGGLLLNNNPATGSFYSPVTVRNGTFGGTGKSDTSVTIGTGSGAGAALEPGNGKIGTLICHELTMHADGAYHVELSPGDTTADKMVVSRVTLDHPKLAITLVNTDALATGSKFTIVDNKGSEAVHGTFNDLAESSFLTVNGNSFRITYQGGSGNDIVLIAERSATLTITSADTATAYADSLFNYSITTNVTASRYHASGLPAGLNVDTATGVISGKAGMAGTYPVTLSASGDAGTATKALTLTVKDRPVVDTLPIDTLPVDTLPVDSLAAQTVVFEVIPEMTVGGDDVLLKAAASSGLPVTFSSSNEAIAVIINSYLHVLKAGNVVITASQAGDSGYQPASARQTIKVIAAKDEQVRVDMYPNPVSDVLIVHLSSVEATTMLEVYDNQGALVHRQQLSSLTNTIDAKRWAPGQYYVRVYNGYVYTNKMVKL